MAVFYGTFDKVDIVDWHSIDESFRERIRNDRVELWKRPH